MAIMAVYWRLDTDVTVAVSAGRAVFLDVARDRYAMLPPHLDAYFAAWLAEPAGPMPHACFDALAARLALDGRYESLRPSRVSLGIPYDVSGSALSGVRPGLGQVLGVASVVMRARRALRRSPLRANLERRRAALGHGLARLVDRRETALRAAVYHAARPFAPAGRVCLLDSLALIDWLGDDAGQAQLVLGVTAYPFGAHCWVQTRQALLGDAPDTIARYAPILHLG